MAVITTAHFIKRCKERLGLNKSAAQSFANNAVYRGKSIEYYKRNQLMYAYFKSMYRPGTIMIIYNNAMVFFTSTYGALTVIKIPKKYLEDNSKEKGGKRHESRRSTDPTGDS